MQWKKEKTTDFGNIKENCRIACNLSYSKTICRFINTMLCKYGLKFIAFAKSFCIHACICFGIREPVVHWRWRCTSRKCCTCSNTCSIVSLSCNSILHNHNHLEVEMKCPLKSMKIFFFFKKEQKVNWISTYRFPYLWWYAALW